MHKIKFDPNDAHLLDDCWVDVYPSGYRAVKCRRDGKKVLASRLLMNPQNGMVVDHINGDTLDNRRSNLRVCTQAQNLRNRKMSKCSSSGFKGVYATGERWRARITSKGDRFYLGSFDNPEAAHEAYCRAAKILHGDFANFG